MPATTGTVRPAASPARPARARPPARPRAARPARAPDSHVCPKPRRRLIRAHTSCRTLSARRLALADARARQQGGNGPPTPRARAQHGPEKRLRVYWSMTALRLDLLVRPTLRALDHAGLLDGRAPARLPSPEPPPQVTHDARASPSALRSDAEILHEPRGKPLSWLGLVVAPPDSHFPASWRRCVCLHESPPDPRAERTRCSALVALGPDCAAPINLNRRVLTVVACRVVA